MIRKLRSLLNDHLVLQVVYRKMADEVRGVHEFRW